MSESDGEAPVRFDEGLAALEALVAMLESGEQSLEDALRCFEEGVALVRRLNGQLAAAEQRIEMLTRSADGRVEARPLDDGEL